MNSECQREWTNLRNKSKNKISHLIQKWQGPEAKICDEWRDIIISDDKLREQFETPDVNPTIDESITLSQSEKEILNLPQNSLCMTK